MKTHNTVPRYRIAVAAAAMFLCSCNIAFSQSPTSKMRPLELSQCGGQFEELRQTVKMHYPKKIAEERASNSPREARIRNWEKTIAAAQNLSGEDFYSTNGGVSDVGQHWEFLKQISRKSVMEQIRDATEMHAALKDGDLDKYASLKGSRPNSPEELAMNLAQSAAAICSLNARLTQITGKPSELTRPSAASNEQCRQEILAIHQRSAAATAAARTAQETNAARNEQMRRQKDLFSSRCANYPGAAGFIATANRVLNESGSSTAAVSADRSTQSASTQPANRSTKVHNPAGEANSCIRPNVGVSYGGFTNVCSYPVSFIHCLTEITKDSLDSWAFHCTRPGGLWATSTTAGGLKAGGTEGTQIPKGARVYWVACRYPFSIENAVFDGKSIQASCIER